VEEIGNREINQKVGLGAGRDVEERMILVKHKRIMGKFQKQKKLQITHLRGLVLVTTINDQVKTGVVLVGGSLRERKAIQKERLIIPELEGKKALREDLQNQFAHEETMENNVGPVDHKMTLCGGGSQVALDEKKEIPGEQIIYLAPQLSRLEYGRNVPGLKQAGKDRHHLLLALLHLQESILTC
jgi:hypothetical protein